MATTAKSTSKKTSGGAHRQSGGKTPAKTSTTKAAPAAQKMELRQRRIIEAVVFLFLGAFACIGYFTDDGWFITVFCGAIKGLIGVGYYVFPPALLLCSLIFIVCRARHCAWRVAASLLLPLIIGATLHLFIFRKAFPWAPHIVPELWKNGMVLSGGGVLGGLLSVGLESAVTVYGAGLVFVCLALLFLAISLELRPARIRAYFAEHAPSEDEYTDDFVPVIPPPAAEPVPAQLPVKEPQKPRRSHIDIPVDGEEQPAALPEQRSFFNNKPNVRTPDQFFTPAELAPEAPTPHTEDVEPLPIHEAAAIAGVQVAEISSQSPAEEAASGKVPVRRRKPPATEPEAAVAAEMVKTIDDAAKTETEKYEYPPVTLLKPASNSVVDSREEVALNRERLDTTLRSFGVNAAIVDVTRGPTVTRYDLALEAGVKLNKITNLAGDLALSLGVASVRIAPIPDKISTVGIEVPNKTVSTVMLREILEAASFQNAQSRLSFALGKDIGGNCIVGNIAKLPHLLIAGTTGSGKSVCMNSLILSLLYKSKPEEVRLIMVDPKMVELGIYNGIPHLYVPVVTDPKKASGALQWSVVEMLKRYRSFSEAGVRDISGYNKMQRGLNQPIMPQVVIVIDELADLMLVASKEVEESICRVAQMGRASGMHLVIATQRPSADVITGLMKANIPSRIAFAVSSAMESRIILDTQGAEKLIGQGDMLYAPLGGGKPQRIQGAFVSDEEREEVIAFIKSGSEARYSDEIMSQIEKAAAEKNGKRPVDFDDETMPAFGGGAPAEEEAAENIFAGYDELLPQAVDVIFETKQASVSMLQRRLKLGYSRAARIVDQMEELGVVGPFEGSKPRQIMITKQQWQEMQMINGTAPLETLPEQLEFELEDGEDEEL